MLLAALLHQTIDPEEIIELINVTFNDDLGVEGERNHHNSPSPDRLAAVAALVELQVDTRPVDYH